MLNGYRVVANGQGKNLIETSRIRSCLARDVRRDVGYGDIGIRNGPATLIVNNADDSASRTLRR